MIYKHPPIPRLVQAMLEDRENFAVQRTQQITSIIRSSNTPYAPSGSIAAQYTGDSGWRSFPTPAEYAAGVNQHRGIPSLITTVDLTNLGESGNNSRFLLRK